MIVTRYVSTMSPEYSTTYETPELAQQAAIEESIRRILSKTNFSLRLDDINEIRSLLNHYERIIKGEKVLVD